MAYATQADVEKAAGGAARLRQISDTSNSGSINASVVADAIDEGAALIDSYAGKRHAVPFAAPVPKIVTLMCAKIAVLSMVMATGNATELDKSQWEFIVGGGRVPSWLERLSRGEVSLGEAPADAPAEMVADTADPNPSSNLDVSRASLEGYW